MNQLLFFVIVSFLKLQGLIPLSMMNSIAKALGWILWVTNSQSKMVTLENLRICFPEKTEAERRHLAKQRMTHLCMTVLELGAIWNRTTKTLLKHMELPGDNTLLDKQLKQGKGVIMLVPHHGNWEALGHYLGDKYEIVCLYQPPKSEVADKIMLLSRSRFSSELAPTNAGGVRVLLKALKRGKIVCILPDQVPPESGGEYANFFGKPAFTMTLVYNLIQRTKAPVLLACGKRINNAGKYFQPLFIDVPQGVYSSDQQESIQALNEGVERVVLESPEQYQWEYKRFKKQPDGQRPYN